MLVIFERRPWFGPDGVFYDVGVEHYIPNEYEKLLPPGTKITDTSKKDDRPDQEKRVPAVKPDDDPSIIRHDTKKVVPEGEKDVEDEMEKLAEKGPGGENEAKTGVAAAAKK